MKTPTSNHYLQKKALSERLNFKLREYGRTTTTSKVLLLGPIKLTWGQTPALPELEEQAYIRGVTAKELEECSRERW